MRKKLPFIILVIIMFVQICIPIGLITYDKIDSSLAEIKGEKFRFNLNYLSYDGNQGKLYFSVDTRSSWMWESNYAEIEVCEDGLVKLLLTNKKPEGDYYIKSKYPNEFTFPLSEIDTDSYENLYNMEFCKDYSEYDYYTPFGYYKDAYLEAYVYKGRVGAPKIYIDGMEADEYLSMLNESRKTAVNNLD